jgi:hypothetical protein
MHLQRLKTLYQSKTGAQEFFPQEKKNFGKFDFLLNFAAKKINCNSAERDLLIKFPSAKDKKDIEGEGTPESRCQCNWDLNSRPRGTRSRQMANSRFFCLLLH